MAQDRFTVARHGYDRTQVREYVERTEADTLRLAAERDEARAAAADMSGRLEQARREIAALTERLDKIGTAAAAAAAPNAQERATRAVEVAKAQAAEITTRAQAAADTAWSAAEEASTALRERYQKLLADLDRQHDEIHAKHLSIMTDAQAKVEAMTTAAEAQQRQIDEQAERDRQRVEQAFQEDMSGKRAELHREIESARAASNEEARRRVQEATDEADKRIAVATSHVERLTALREQLAGRLRGTYDLLTKSTALLEPLEAEAELTPDSPAALTENKGDTTTPLQRPTPQQRNTSPAQ
ncbi:hypothetical protein [Actinokineospora sp. HUAS TT18]|uniref:hypothetical protein n=1 Tax=Actinokineospora sp. HUAS TT18 TaxID=3447451 RepID=UPI003F51FA81